MFAPHYAFYIYHRHFNGHIIRDLYTADLIHNDRDMDGDTTLDAGSVGIVFDADTATISGVGG